MNFFSIDLLSPLYVPHTYPLFYILQMFSPSLLSLNFVSHFFQVISSLWLKKFFFWFFPFGNKFLDYKSNINNVENLGNLWKSIKNKRNHPKSYHWKKTTMNILTYFFLVLCVCVHAHFLLRWDHIAYIYFFYLLSAMVFRHKLWPFSMCPWFKGSVRLPSNSYFFSPHILKNLVG